MPRSAPLAADDRLRLLEAIRAGVDRETAATYVGLAATELVGLLAADAELAAAVDAAEASVKVSVVATVMKAAKNGDVRAAEFMLERAAKPAKPRARCGATGKQTGLPCGHAPGLRTKHPGFGRCYLHGGNTPNGIRFAQQQQAELAVAKLGMPAGTGSPFTLLTKAIRHAEGYLEASARVLVDVVDEKRTDVDMPAAIAAYVRGIREAARTAKAAVDADVADRLAAVDEQMGVTIHRVFTAALDAAGVKGAARAAAEEALVRELVAVGPAGDERN